MRVRDAYATAREHIPRVPELWRHPGMSEDLICADCGQPFSEHDEFREAVDERVEQKLAEHKYFTQLVAHKMSPDTVPKPRTESLDALDHARIKASARQREIPDRAMRLVEE